MAESKIVPEAALRVVPANQVAFDDLQEVFGDRGPAARCQCQRYRLGRGESFGKQPVEERRHRLREQTGCGDPDAPTCGLVAWLQDEPVGWCAVGPRSELSGLKRVFTVPWKGRDEDPDDPDVWAVTCLYTRRGHRRRGGRGIPAGQRAVPAPGRDARRLLTRRSRRQNRVATPLSAWQGRAS